MTRRRLLGIAIAIAIALSAVVAAALLLRTNGTQDGIAKFQKLDATLYRGAQPHARDFKDLEKLGVRTIINLRKRHSDESMLKGTSLRYRNIGMNVWQAEDDHVIAFLKLVKDRSKGPFFIHCQQGVDRTGFMCAIYRIVVQGWTKEKALAEMRRFKPHRIWTNLERYIRKMDVKAVRKKTGF